MVIPKFQVSESEKTRLCPTSLFLVGFMGAGKTTVGRVLACRLGWNFIDLDDRIEAAEGRRVADIFAAGGEPAFRVAEAQALTRVIVELQQGLEAVVALGGGAFAQPRNTEAIRATRVPVIFLDAPAQELHQRCAPAGASRPLFQDRDAFFRLYRARKSSYLQADFRVDTAGKSVPEVAAEVLALLGVSGS